MLQSLVNRNLLSSDIGVEMFASDVNGNGQVEPVDLLQAINALHSQKQGSIL